MISGYCPTCKKNVHLFTNHKDRNDNKITQLKCGFCLSILFEFDGNYAILLQKELDTEIDTLVDQKNELYRERNHLLVLISKLFPAFLCRNSPKNELYKKGMTHILSIDFPFGKETWAIYDRDLAFFTHLKNLNQITCDVVLSDFKYDHIWKLTSNRDDLLNWLNSVKKE